MTMMMHNLFILFLLLVVAGWFAISAEPNALTEHLNSDGMQHLVVENDIVVKDYEDGFHRNLLLFSLFCFLYTPPNHNDDVSSFTMPSEEDPHEGTWLQWPHNYGLDPIRILRYESTWIEMTRALHTGEKVHIIAYDVAEVARIRIVLGLQPGVDMDQIDFTVARTNDVWIRDNGPIFTYDDNNGGALVVQNWKFNGWGRKAPFRWDNQIPSRVATTLRMTQINVDMVNEGGSFEVDGRGTLMAKKSSILINNRNPCLTQQDAETFFSHYIGVTNFIWLEGVKGLDITDDHIDGTARFANGDTIVTLSRNDMFRQSDYDVISNARDANGDSYRIVELPLTSRVIPQILAYGSYVNYYVGNEVVLIPAYNDPNDQVAADILAELYPSRTIVPIVNHALARDGGMVHCVTQQQPVEL